MAWLAQLEGVPSAYAAVRDGIDVMLRDRGLRKTSPEQTAQSLLRGAYASAVLEGSVCTQEQVRDGDLDEPAAAAVRLSTEVLSLVPVFRQSPIQAFARLHAIAAAGQVDESRLGRPRDQASAERLQQLAGTINAATTSPALLVAGLVHADLATAAPFSSHNGIVARAAERLVMVARGVDEKSLMVPEAGHLALRPQYESNLRGYASGTQKGLHAWVLYAAEAFSAGAEASPLRS